MTIKLSSDQFAIVDTDWYLYDIEEVPPPTARNAIMLCGNIHTGKTIISDWNPAFKFTHWAPLPVFPKDE